MEELLKAVNNHRANRAHRPIIGRQSASRCPTEADSMSSVHGRDAGPRAAAVLQAVDPVAR